MSLSSVIKHPDDQNFMKRQLITDLVLIKRLLKADQKGDFETKFPSMLGMCISGIIV